MRKAIALVLLLAISTDARAQSNGNVTASSMALLCSNLPLTPKEDAAQAETVCGAFFLGISDAMYVMQQLAETGTRTCMPTEMSLGVPEIRTLFINYLKAHPEVANNSAGLVAVMASVNAFKCGR